MKKILITGGSGLIGSALLRVLDNTDIDILAVSSKDFDLREQNDVRRLFKWFKPDEVYHCAATVGGIYANATMGGKFFYENAIMNVLLYEEARKNDVKRLISMGSGCMYPARPKLPTDESLIWQGIPEITNEPYAIAKRMLVTQTDAYKKQYGFSSAVAILSNQYGPNDNFHLEDGHLVPSLVRKFVEAKQNNMPVTLWGSGNITRDFIYSDDTAIILSKLMESDFCGAVNIGSGIEVSLKQLVDVIKEELDFKNEIIFDSSKPDGEPRKYLDLTLLNNTIKMPELLSLKEGINKTIQWFIENQNNYRSDKK